MSQGVPKAARDFIAGHIHSVAQLEVLLYARAKRDEPVTPEGVARDQKIVEQMAFDLLTDLTARGLLEERSDSFIYRPNADLARQVDAVADVYGAYRVAIISMIFSRPPESIRSFGEAFRVRKDEE